MRQARVAATVLAYVAVLAALVFEVWIVRYGALALALLTVNLGAGALIGRWWATALPLIGVFMAIATGVPDEPGLTPGEPYHVVDSQDHGGARFFVLSQLALAAVQAAVIFIGVSVRKLVRRPPRTARSRPPRSGPPPPAAPPTPSP